MGSRCRKVRQHVTDAGQTLFDDLGAEVAHVEQRMIALRAATAAVAHFGEDGRGSLRRGWRDPWRTARNAP